MFTPRASSRELNRFSNGNSNEKHMNYLSSNKDEFRKKSEETTMEGLNGGVGGDSDFQSSGLMRFRSAPSSLLANFIDGGEDPDFLHGSSSPEPDNVFARFISCDSSCLTSESMDLKSVETRSSVKEEEEMNQRRSLLSVVMENETEMVEQSSSSNNNNNNNGFSAGTTSQILYQQSQNHGLSARAAIDGSTYRMSIESHIKNGQNAPVSSLIRHSSSPAGFFSRLNVENGGYSVMRGGGSRLKNQIRFSRNDSSATGLMSQIPEIGSESMGASSSDDGSCYIPGFPLSSWEDSHNESFNGLELQRELVAGSRKRVRDINGKVLPGFNSSESQNRETGNHGPLPGLTHHFSLPKTSAELAQLENMLQIQGSVPCKIRAKRGHATHPRSIAERVRRTKISERIRKLQDLVPNMDKQTNTADMLELAVEYIKDLKKQVKTLSDNRSSCTCSSKVKNYPYPAV